MVRANVNIGIVGAGEIGIRHAQAYANHQKCEAVAVCDIDAARAEQLSDAYENLHIGSHQGAQRLQAHPAQ